MNAHTVYTRLFPFPPPPPPPPPPTVLLPKPDVGSSCDRLRLCACAPRSTLASGALILNNRSVYIPTCTLAHSYEPRRTNAYSEVLRWRMVWQREALACQIASNLGVDISTVQRTVQLFLNSGSVCISQGKVIQETNTSCPALYPQPCSGQPCHVFG